MSNDRLSVDRDELTRHAQFLVNVIDNPNTDAAMREQAQQRFDELSDLLCYAGGEVPNVSVLFVYCGYREAVEQILPELPPEVLAEQTLRVMLIRHAAELADTPAFSDDFRLDAVDSMNQILTSLKRCADAELDPVK
jgi:hypothetical protein